MHLHELDPSDWPDEPTDGEIDLGASHYLRFTCHGTEGDVHRRILDEDLWRSTDGAQGVEEYVLTGQPTLADGRAATGALIRHRQPRSPSGWCEGAVGWWEPYETGRAKWTLVSLEPLHIEPSVLCKAPMPDGSTCDDHGHIRAGRWIGA